MSVMDDLFYEIYGFRPNKDGAAYEMLAAAVVKLLEKDTAVTHDVQLRGKFSKSLYQLDVFYENDGESTFGEAKDYTERGGKVGRPDLQKLGGALPDLDVSRAAFFSATDFTAPAKKYAAASTNIVGKEIDLVHLRKSNDSDREGRIETVHITIWSGIPNYSGFKVLDMVFTAEGQTHVDEIRATLKDGEELRCPVQDTLLDKAGQPLYSLGECVLKSGTFETSEAHATLLLRGAHVQWNGQLVPLRGITYTMPWLWLGLESVIGTTGTPRLLVKYAAAGVDKLITDEQLRTVSFGPNGEAILDEQH